MGGSFVPSPAFAATTAAIASSISCWWRDSNRFLEAAQRCSASARARSTRIVFRNVVPISVSRGRKVRKDLTQFFQNLTTSCSARCIVQNLPTCHIETYLYKWRLVVSARSLLSAEKHIDGIPKITTKTAGKSLIWRAIN